MEIHAHCLNTVTRVFEEGSSCADWAQKLSRSGDLGASGLVWCIFLNGTVVTDKRLCLIQVSKLLEEEVFTASLPKFITFQSSRFEASHYYMTAGQLRVVCYPRYAC
jgi:hypothetical protein